MCRIALFLCLSFAALVHCKPADKYTTKFDNIDLDQILMNDRLINSYFKCLMTGKGCTADGLELKKDLPDALKTGCSKCSEKQKEGSKKIIEFIYKERRNLWDQIEKKYDAEGTYRKMYEAQFKEQKLSI